jgi:hypothetical protein
MKAHRESRCTVPLILHLCIRWRWVVNFIPWPLYPQKKYTSTRWIESLVSHTQCGHFWKRPTSVFPARIHTPDCPAQEARRCIDYATLAPFTIYTSYIMDLYCNRLPWVQDPTPLLWGLDRGLGYSVNGMSCHSSPPMLLICSFS